MGRGGTAGGVGLLGGLVGVTASCGGLSLLGGTGGLAGPTLP